MNSKQKTRILTIAVVMWTIFAVSANASWTPAELTKKAELWLDAADASTITKNSDNLVSQWNDKSGNDRHVSQTGSAKPIYMETGFNEGAMPSLDFPSPNPGAPHDGRALVHSLSAELQESEWVVFAVVDDQGNDGESFLLAAPAGGYNEHRFKLQSNGTSVRSDSNNGGSATAAQVLGEQQLYFALSGTSSQVLRNGTEAAGNNGTYVDRPIVTRIAVGARGDTGHAGINGEIAELILLSYVPSKDDREMIEGYLAWKWGLVDELPEDHTYKSAAPGDDPNLPFVDPGYDMIAWLGADVVMDPCIVLPVGSNWTDLTYKWTTDAPAGYTVQWVPGDTVEVPTLTVTRDIPAEGDTMITVTVSLEVNNSSRTEPGVKRAMTIDFYDDACKAKQAAVEVMTYDPTDLNKDCITDIEDFAMLALEWLVNYQITAPQSKW